MPHASTRCLRALAVAGVALAALTSCASNRLLQQHANPEYVGKPFKRVLVVAVTNENVLGRVYEDRMVALLGQRGIKGVPGYVSLGTGAADEAKLRRVIAETGADGMLITRTTSVDQATVTSPGYTVTVGIGTGWGGFYNYYSGIWQTTYVPPQTTVVGPTRTVSETRLFDTKSGALAWSGMIGTTERGDAVDTSMVEQYARIVFDAMAGDGIL